MPIISSSAALTLSTYTLESGNTKHTIQFTTLPPIEGLGSDRRAKSIAFDSLIQQLRAYAPQHNITTLTHALNSVLPTSGQTVQARATEDSRACIDHALANPNYLEVTGFALSSGQRVSLADSPSQRLPNIEWMLLRCTTPAGSALHPDLPPSFKEKTITFAMRLPQAAYRPKSSTSTPAPLTVSPWEQSSPTISPFRQFYAHVSPALTAAYSRAAAWLSPLRQAATGDLNAAGNGAPHDPAAEAPAGAFTNPAAGAPNSSTAAASTTTAGSPFNPATVADAATAGTQPGTPAAGLTVGPFAATPPDSGLFGVQPQVLFPPTHQSFAPILHTYLGPTNPTASHTIFNQIFPPGSLIVPFRHSSSSTNVYIEESSLGHPIIAQLTETIHLELLIQYHRRNYVGSVEVCSTDAVKGASAALMALEFDPTSAPSTSGPATSPAGLYERFQSLFPSFPAADTHIWGLNFFQTYFNKLPPTLQESIRQDQQFVAASLPGGPLDIYTMSNKRSQEDATALLRDIATRCFDSQQDQLSIIAQQFGLKPLPTTQSSKSTRSHHLGPSSAESTMQRYSSPPPHQQPPAQSPSPSPADYTTKDSDGYTLLLCPQAHPSACLACYSADHKYNPQDCKLYGHPSARARLGRNIAHRRDLGLLRPKQAGLPRFNSPDWDSTQRPSTNSGTHYGPGTPNQGHQTRTAQPSPYSSNPPSHSALQYTSTFATSTTPSRASLRGLSNEPSWVTHPSTYDTSTSHSGNTTHHALAPAPAPPPGVRPATGPPAGFPAQAKHARPSFHTLRVNCHHTGSQARALPCPIDNGLPHITLPLASSSGPTLLELTAMVDTGSAITAGNLAFHIWLFKQYPTAVHSLELFNDADTPFDPLRLQGALTEGTSAPPEHGALTGVIRYNLGSSPDSSQSQAPTAFLTIALGASVNVNTIFGWPSIQSLGCDILSSQNLIASSVLNHRFCIQKRAARCGLPDGIHFDLDTYTASPEFSTLRTSLPRVNLIQSSDSCQDGFLVRQTTA